MPVKRNTYIDVELDWLEIKLAELKKFMDDRPFDLIIAKKGESISSQVKMLRDSMKDYIEMVAAVNKLREAADTRAKLTPRGDAVLSPREQGLMT